MSSADAPTATPASPPRASLTRRQRRALGRLRGLARLFDARFRLPGTELRFGVDPLIGLVPGVGDVLSAALSASMLRDARTLGCSRIVLARMAGNLVVDALIGAIPLAGDLFDFGFKANSRNVRLVEADLRRRGVAATSP